MYSGRHGRLTLRQVATVLRREWDWLYNPARSRYIQTYRSSGSSPVWYAAVPAESTSRSIPRSLATCLRTASPMGDRQMFPRHTTRADGFDILWAIISSLVVYIPVESAARITQPVWELYKCIDEDEAKKQTRSKLLRQPTIYDRSTDRDALGPWRHGVTSVAQLRITLVPCDWPPPRTIWHHHLFNSCLLPSRLSRLWDNDKVI